MSNACDELMMWRWKQFSPEVELLLDSASHVLGEAAPPEMPGIYVLYDEHKNLSYVGIAVNLRDRILNKHVSGDESHAIQRAYAPQFPDRTERRKFIKENVQVKWRPVSDPIQLADLERLLIWLHQPKWNRR